MLRYCTTMVCCMVNSWGCQVIWESFLIQPFLATEYGRSAVGAYSFLCQYQPLHRMIQCLAIQHQQRFKQLWKPLLQALCYSHGLYAHGCLHDPLHEQPLWWHINQPHQWLWHSHHLYSQCFLFPLSSPSGFCWLLDLLWWGSTMALGIPVVSLATCLASYILGGTVDMSWSMVLCSFCIVHWMCYSLVPLTSGGSNAVAICYISQCP